MILQRSRYILDCPVCGRPVEIQSQHVGIEIACGHCRGQYVVDWSADRQPVAATIRERSLLERADRLLRIANRKTRVLETFILVEHRDDVFARLAADAEQLGAEVVRAESVGEAMLLVDLCDFALVVSSRDLPGQTGWVLADKLGQTAPRVEVWLYMPQISAYADELARLLNVSKLLVYEGDLSSLSDAVAQRLADRLEPSSAVRDIRKPASAQIDFTCPVEVSVAGDSALNP